MVNIKVPESGVTYYGDRIIRIRDILIDKKAAVYIKKALQTIFGGLELSKHDLSEIISFIINSGKEYSTLREYERSVHDFLEQKGVFKDFFIKVTDRAQKMFEISKPYLVGKKILDLGCGTGKIGAIAKSFGYDVTLVDVYKNPAIDKLNMPFIKITQDEKLPFKEMSFDNIFLFTMLHHTKNPLDTIEESRRVLKTGGRLHLIETVFGIKGKDSGRYYGLDDSEFKKLSKETQRKVMIFFDYFGNHVTWYYTDDPEKFVPVPFNFTTPGRLKKLFEQNGFKIVHHQLMGIHDVSQTYHLHLVLEKMDKQVGQ